MGTKQKLILLILNSAFYIFHSYALAPIDRSENRNPSPLRVEMTRIGTLRPEVMARVGEALKISLGFSPQAH